MSDNYSNFELFKSKYLKYKSKYLTLRKSIKGGDFLDYIGYTTYNTAVYINVSYQNTDLKKIYINQIKLENIPSNTKLRKHILKEVGLAHTDDSLKTLLANISFNGSELTVDFTAYNYNNNSGKIDETNRGLCIELVYNTINTEPTVTELINSINYYSLEDNNKTYEKSDNRAQLRNIPAVVFTATYNNKGFLDSLKLQKNKDYSFYTILPACIGFVISIGDISLDGVSLLSLPDSIGNLNVGGSLILNNCSLSELPVSFSNIRVGNSLILSNNNIRFLPVGFLEKIKNTIKFLDIRHNYLPIETIKNTIKNINYQPDKIKYDPQKNYPTIRQNKQTQQSDTTIRPNNPTK